MNFECLLEPFVVERSIMTDRQRSPEETLLPLGGFLESHQPTLLRHCNLTVQIKHDRWIGRDQI